MKNSGYIMSLVIAPGFAFAHEGVDPASILHTLAHLGESYGLLIAVPVALAIGVVLKRRRATVKSDR